MSATKAPSEGVLHSVADGTRWQEMAHECREIAERTLHRALNPKGQCPQTKTAPKGCTIQKCRSGGGRRWQTMAEQVGITVLVEEGSEFVTVNNFRDLHASIPGESGHPPDA